MKMNMKKTKVMCNKYATVRTVKIGNVEVEYVDEYVYLGQLVTMNSDKTDEIKRRISAGWGAFSKYYDIMKSKMPICLKKKIYNRRIEAAMTYGCQTWTVTKPMQNRLSTTQRSMEKTRPPNQQMGKTTNRVTGYN